MSSIEADDSEEESMRFVGKKGLLIESDDEDYIINSNDSEEESMRFVGKKGLLIESDDEDYIINSSKEMSDFIISQTPSPSFSGNFSKSTITTSTPSKSTAYLTLTPQYTEGQSFRTPRNKESETLSSDTDDDHDEVFISSDSDIIDGSLEDTFPKEKQCNLSTLQTLKLKTPKQGVGGHQPTLDSFVKKLTLNNQPEHDHTTLSSSSSLVDKIKCKRSDYNQQLEKIRQYEQEMLKTKNHISTIKLSVLPDKGQLLKAKFETCKNNFLSAQERLSKMIVIEEDHSEELTGKALVVNNWTNLEAGIHSVQPKTFGKKGLENYNIQKALTVERLEQLHGSLKNCPTDTHFADDPKGLKVGLMAHQKRALAWLEYRESQKPAGGILADDMGLGKTLTMIALVLKTKSHSCTDDSEDENETSNKKHRKYNGGTLVVCPASLLYQWSGEIDSKLKRGLLSYLIYHGPKRETKSKRLAEYDVVITTYSLVMNESEKGSTLSRVRWKRIILDEAHQIRNHKSLTSVACCELAAKYRWALTGTPVHNKELDMYALLKFLRCTPFDDLAVWKRWVTDKSVGGGERLHTVISSLMLRRTKAELIESGSLTTLPSRKWDLISISLDAGEMGIYQKILIFSQTLFAQFLHQKAEKNQEFMNLKNPNGDPNSEYFKMRQKLLKLNKLKEVNQHEILVLLLRLRQICCHPSLITNMLQGDEDLGDCEQQESEEINLLEQLNNLNLNESELAPDNTNGYTLDLSEKGVGFKEATKNILNPSHPIFARDRKSSKIRTVMKMIPNILSAGDKIIIVSQWKSYLELIGIHLKDVGAKYLKLDGSVSTTNRKEIISSFNDAHSQFKVLLLSLTAGGVGLNLVGANHLFLVDLHWNPQLENQAQDRIYRMGQKKDVFIYKFIARDTIEERIKQLQENKLAISDSLMTGSRQVVNSKLSLQDLKMLFNM